MMVAELHMETEKVNLREMKHQEDKVLSVEWSGENVRPGVWRPELESFSADLWQLTFSLSSPLPSICKARCWSRQCLSRNLSIPLVCVGMVQQKRLFDCKLIIKTQLYLTTDKTVSLSDCWMPGFYLFTHKLDVTCSKWHNKCPVVFIFQTVFTFFLTYMKDVVLFSHHRKY